MEAGTRDAGRRHRPQARPDQRDRRRRRRRTSPTRTSLRIEENACPTCGSCSGMFTANSMNCLTEALGLALPGNGSVLATHTARKALYEDAGRTVVELTKRYYDQDDETRAAARHRHPRPRSRTRWRWTSRWAARPTRSCTCWPPPRRPSVDLRPDRHRRGLAPRALPGQGRAERPGGTYYMEDVHRAGGIPAILGELHRGGLLNEDVHTVHSPTRRRVARRLGHPRRLRRRRRRSSCSTPRPAASARPPPSRSPSAGRRWTPTRPAAASATSSTPTPTTAASRSCTATSPADGCVVKTAGVDESIWTFRARRSSASPRRRPSRRSSPSRSRRATSS